MNLNIIVHVHYKCLATFSSLPVLQDQWQSFAIRKRAWKKQWKLFQVFLYGYLDYLQVQFSCQANAHKHPRAIDAHL